MIEEILLFFAQNGIYLVIIVSLLNFKNEGKSLLALAMALAISFAAGLIFYSPPPFVQGNFKPLMPFNSPSSFPSHPASAGFALSASTFNTNTILGIISSAIATLMAIGSIYAGIHSKVDVIGSLFIAGFSVMFAYSNFVDRIIWRLQNKIKYYREKKAAHKIVSSNPKKRRKNSKRS